MDVSQHRQTRTSSLGDVLSVADRTIATGDGNANAPLPSGFRILDEMTGGGLRPGELVLLGGPPGVGKTVMALQWARHLALSGHRALYVCYEHDELALLSRLVALEAGLAGVDPGVATAASRAVTAPPADTENLDDALTAAGAWAVVPALRRYADNLVLVRASGAHTTIEELDEVVQRERRDGQHLTLVVDYLQKVPLQPEPATEAEKVTRTVEALKDLALTERVGVVALSAVDAAGMRTNRLRMHHLRGSSAIAFEADVVLMLNEKVKAVSKVHLAYDSVRARTFRDWTVVSVEKNRGGPNLVDLEFRQHFEQFRYDTEGGIVAETLVSEHLDEHAV